MEKTGLQILAEIRDTLSALNGKIAQIEFQLEELEGFMCYGELDKMASEIAPEPLPESVAAPGTVSESAVVLEPAVETDPVFERDPVIVAAPEPVSEAESELEPAATQELVAEEAVAAPESVTEHGPVHEPAAASETVSESVVIPGPEPEPDFVLEPEPPTVNEPEQVIDLPAIDVNDVIDDLPGDLIDLPDVIIADASSPVESINDAVSAKVQSSVLDMMFDECAWKKDRPGTPVKNIISGISLNDRLLFIKTLFKEDAELFRHTIEEFNSFSALSQAEEYIKSNLSWWKMDSDTVYRFMMAVRRKLGK